jgi:hypothetical protein
LCGTRRAAQLWEEFWAKTVKQYGCQRSAVAAGCFCSQVLGVACAVHADDFLAEGLPSNLDQLDKLLQESMDVKILSRIGPGASRVGRYLKRKTP